MEAIDVAEGLVTALGVYLGLGLLFAVPFVWVGAGRVDSNAAGGTLGFRLLILPGSILLWPLLLRRWIGATGAPPIERNAHRDAAGEAVSAAAGAAAGDAAGGTHTGAAGSP